MSGTVARSDKQISYYTILGLPEPQQPGEVQLTDNVLKLAYRRALLVNHPDKTAGLRGLGGDAKLVTTTRYTIDDITEAYEKLANPKSRAAYNEGLLRARNKARLATNNDIKCVSSPGLDVLDLDDLEYNESAQVWSRNCRCGGSYQLAESQLDKVAAEGEVVVGCQGCSLCVRVMFESVDE